MLLSINKLCKSYGSPGAEAERVQILRDLDLEVDQGQSVAIVGPSGSGKSTLLNIVGALDDPTSGEVRLGDTDVVALKGKEAAHYRNAVVGMVFQLHHLLPQCTLLENVLVPTLAGKRMGQRTEAGDRAKELLEQVGLGPRMNHRPGEVSGGERQRAAVARALINNPQLLLADEPTGSLDQASSGNLADLLAELNEKRGVTLILVTHSRSLAGRMGRVLELQEGRLVEAASS